MGQVFPIRDFPDSSVAKESSCNAGDAGSIPGLGRSPGEGIGYLLQYSWASPVAQLVKNRPAMQDLGLILGLGRSPGEGKGYPLQYSGLENSVNCIVHGVEASQTRLSGFHFHFFPISLERKEKILQGLKGRIKPRKREALRIP